MNLTAWLQYNNISNPHCIPSSKQVEFDALFSNTQWFWPQPGGQEDFLNCPADICLYGGAAGAGKSFSLLMDLVKWVNVPLYKGIIVRKTYSLVFDSGGLWDEAKNIYPPLGGKPSKGERPKFIFNSGLKNETEIFFKHSQHEGQIKELWQGIQGAVIAIDELTQFSLNEFEYFVTRNRSKSEVRSYIRATCNPEPGSWVRDLIDWWIDEDGYIIEERSGKIKWLVNKDDKFILADTKEELIERFGPKTKPKSFTFIRGYLKDNKFLDDDYEANLQLGSAANQHALLDGNWNELHDPDKMFQRSHINANRIDSIDIKDLNRIVIGVDPAGSTGNNSDLTGIVVVGEKNNNGYPLADESGKYKPNEWAKKVCDLYDAYKADCIVAEKNFGGDMVFSTINNYRNDICPRMVNASRGKEVRAEPVSMLYEQNRIHHVGHNLRDLENEMCKFDPEKVRKKEMKSPNRLDALVWAINELIAKKRKPEPRIIYL